MRRPLLLAVVLVLAGITVSEAADRIWGDREWEARVQAAERFAAAERETAKLFMAVSDSIAEEAERARAAADARAARAMARYDSILTVPVPDECADLVAQRDSIITDLVITVDTLTLAFDKARTALRPLKEASTGLLAVNDTLGSVLAARPKPKPAWVPSVGVGVFAGFCNDGRACAGVGVSFTWKVNIL
jgi:hypothetical protein